MPEIKLFNISTSNKSTQIKSKSLKLERQIQNIVERNLEELFGIKFLASEYIIDNGRVDTLGLDENNCPVVIEYKLNSNTARRAGRAPGSPCGTPGTGRSRESARSHARAGAWKWRGSSASPASWSTPCPPPRTR